MWYLLAETFVDDDLEYFPFTFHQGACGSVLAFERC
jgi:hypothetical protein